MEWDPRENAKGKANGSISRQEPQTNPQHYALPDTMDTIPSKCKQKQNIPLYACSLGCFVIVMEKETNILLK